MKEIITFLVDNWQPILSAFLSFVALILVIVKKRPQAYSIGDYVRLIVSQFLPGYICDAERTGMTGDRKREHVLNQCMKALKGFVRADDKELEECYVQFTNAIESILSTPRKK